MMMGRHLPGRLPRSMMAIAAAATSLPRVRERCGTVLSSPRERRLAMRAAGQFLGQGWKRICHQGTRGDRTLPHAAQGDVVKELLHGKRHLEGASARHETTPSRPSRGSKGVRGVRVRGVRMRSLKIASGGALPLQGRRPASRPVTRHDRGQHVDDNGAISAGMAKDIARSAATAVSRRSMMTPLPRFGGWRACGASCQRGSAVLSRTAVVSRITGCPHSRREKEATESSG